MKPSSPVRLLLMLQCILQLFSTSSAEFSFTVTVFSYTTSGGCDTALFSACETFLNNFCLRGPRGTGSRSGDLGDCPLGRETDDVDGSGIITITSDEPWPGEFQLLIEARDDDSGVTSSDFLDNIFVDRSLEADVGVPTTLSQYRGDRSRVTLLLSFRVDCEDDFYGNDCTDFCVAGRTFTCNEEDGSRICLPDYYGEECDVFCQDNVDGFYTCDEEDGSRICDDGYTNPEAFCTENIDDCAESPCENGGTCDDLVDDFICLCPAGYTGELCSEDINECLEANCPGNSICVQDAPASFQCQCNPGFEGEQCTEIQRCESVTCENGGTCVSDNPFSHECLCPPGFNGTACENDLDECLLEPCQNGGTCVTGEPSTFQCHCAEGYGGQLCEFDENENECLSADACPAGLVCINDEIGFRCLPEDQVDGGSQVGGGNESSQGMTLIIGAAVGGVVILIILILIVAIIILLTRRRSKYYRNGRSDSHIYQPGPALPDPVKYSSLSPTIQQGDNPLYGTQNADKADLPDLHVLANGNVYDGTAPEVVIYDEVHTDVQKLEAFESTTNIAYESLMSPHKTEAISNPMYTTSGGKAVSFDPPTYSVPKPATPALKEVDGYTILTDAGNMEAGHAVPPPSSDTPAPNNNGSLKEVDGYTILKDARNNTAPSSPVPQPSSSPSSSNPPPPAYESVELQSKASNPKPEVLAGPNETGTELVYAEPSTRRCASGKDTRYNTLDSAPPPAHLSTPEQPTVRLAAIPGAGYTTLETES